MNKAFDKILKQLEEKAIPVLNEDEHIIPESNVKEPYEIEMVALSDIKKTIQEVAEEYNGGWIPCSDRLPEENKQVILQDFYGNITIEKMKTNDGIEGFSDGDWWASANNYVAWHPLPELYKESD